MAGQTFHDSGIDKSIGLLLLGLGVAGFFILTIMGMQSMQQNAQSVADEPARTEVAEPVYDIGS